MYGFLKLSLFAYGIALGYQIHKHDLVNKAVTAARAEIQELHRSHARVFLAELEAYRKPEEVANAPG